MKSKRTMARSTHYSTYIRIVGMILFPLLIVLYGGSLASYNPHDPSWLYYSSEQTFIHNLFGSLGAHIAVFLVYCFGYAAWLWIVTLSYAWYYLFVHCSLRAEYDRLLAVLCMPFVGAAFVHMHGNARMLGGASGRWISGFLGYWFEFPGTWLCVYSMMLMSCVLIVRPPLARLAELILHGIYNLTCILMSRERFWQPLVRFIGVCVRMVWYPCDALIKRYMPIFNGSALHEQDQTLIALEYEDLIQQDSVLQSDPFWRAMMQPLSADNQEQDVPWHCPADALDVQDQIENRQEKHEADAGVPSYRLPNLSLFIGVDTGGQTSTLKAELEQCARTLEEKLERFDVRGRVVAIKHGPVVTLYEYQPEIDSKISKIIALEDDLALALQALSIRIIAPIPGRSVVGFEVSNAHRTIVLLSKVIRSCEFTACTGALPLILGEDTIGNNVVVDLASMPHLLIAGSTGSGKSVALNAMLVSLLCKRTPDELRLILIDPKRLEFAAYADIAHLLFPIVTDPKITPAILTWVVEEMERRYERIVQEGVRNSADYNKRVAREQQLPRIVVIIDELADLMMTAGRDVENLITRIAQMARAAGIHLIVATQRPSVDVITGLIKANFPSRISFRVTSKVDSRIILDCVGADKLLGRGDMLFLDAGSALLNRVHGAYVSDKEIQDLVQHIKAERTVHYLELPQPLEGDIQNMSETDRQLYNEVLVYLNEIEEVSISLLQRKFRIGYNRSARIIDLLEEQGRIMPSEGGKTRRIFR